MKALLIILMSLLFALIPGKGESENTMTDYEKKWKQVEKYKEKGLPRSALEVVTTIYHEAKQNNNTPQFLKALIYRLSLQSEFEVNYNEQAIKTLNKEIDSATNEVQKSLLHSMQGELFWNYYRQNRFKISERSATKVIEQDIATWDIRTILQHARKHYHASLDYQQPAAGKDLEAIAEILTEHVNTLHLRPTIYDFVAYRALDFFQSSDYLLTKANLEIAYRDKALFDTVKEFLRQDFSSNPHETAALQVYQSLLRLHQNNEAALAEANMKRLEHVQQNHVAANSKKHYREALAAFATRIEKNPEWSLVKYYLAKAEYTTDPNPRNAEEHTHKNQQAAAALKHCNEATEAYPDSYGASRAKAFREQILQKNLTLSVEHAVPPKKPFPVAVSYANFKEVHFRLYRINPDGAWNQKRLSREDKLEFLLRKQPLLFFSKKLTDEDKYVATTTELIMPPAAPGFYVLLASASPDFIPKDKPTTFAELWVTNISFVNWEHDNNNVELTFLDRQDGQAIKKADVSCISRSYDYKTQGYDFETLKKFETARDGRLQITDKDIQATSFYLDIKKGDDRYISPSNFYLRKTSRNQKERTNIYLFTDRTLYRPGQTIHFKGLALSETRNQSSAIITDYKTTVELRDVNNRILDEKRMVTNDYGSFSGSFVLPEEALNGVFTLRTPQGRARITVEEYRRPRFVINTEPMKGAYKVNETVFFKGRAEALAGYAVDGAEVAYRVTRQPRFPFLRGIPYEPLPEITLKAGTTTTDADGAFEIPFVTAPDATIPREQKPVFNYQVTVKITDKNGETHEKQASVVAGYDSFFAEIEVEKEVNRHQTLEIKPAAKNLSGEPVVAEGTLQVEKLKDFDRLYTTRPWAKPDEYLLSKEEYQMRIPHFPYGDAHLIESLEEQEQMLSTGFYTQDSIFTADISNWEPGAYKITFSVSKNRETHKAEKRIIVYDPDSKQMPLTQHAFFKVNKETLQPGETVKILVGSAAARAEVYLRAEQNGNIFYDENITLKSRQKTIEIPIEESHRGGFTLHASFVYHNRQHQWKQPISVPYDNKELDLHLEVNRTPLLPGSSEQWTLHVKGPGNKKVAAEILAGMYDAALDEIKPFAPWSLKGLHPSYSGVKGWASGGGFGMAQGTRLFVNTGPGIKPKTRTYPGLNWFGYHHLDMNLKRVRTMENAPATKQEQVFMAVEDKSAEKDKDAGKSPAIEETSSQQQPQIRKNFNETAFFYPQLQSKGDSVSITFTLPESLTTWKFMALAHTKDLKSGDLSKMFKASKDLMVVPNAPRFVRENDRISFAAKVVNLSDKSHDITVSLDLFDTPQDILITETLGLKNNQRKVTLPAGESKQVTFPLEITTRPGLLKYRITAAAATFTDGEENYIPVLTNRKRLTETRPFAFRNAGEKTVEVPSFRQSEEGRLTVEYTGNAAWYAVQAMPYLDNPESKSSLSIANTLYANSLGKQVVDRHPEIEEVFRLWKTYDQEALRSNLEKNKELKNVVIAHTPWLLEAKAETSSKKRIAAFFDDNKLQYHRNQALEKLRDQQRSNGGWSWHPGMQPSQYITQSVVLKLTELLDIGAVAPQEVEEMIASGMEFCAAKMEERYERLRKNKDFDAGDYKPTNTEVLFLYTRAILKAPSLSAKAQKIAEEYEALSLRHRTRYNKYMQGMIALMSYHNNEKEEAKAIVRSLKEYALTGEDGMYWRDFERGWHWYQAPIDFQALMIRLFDKAGENSSEVEAMKLWLLKQKQTQQWPTSSATAKAVYALLTTGKEMLSASNPEVTIEVGETRITTDAQNTQAGTGYFKKSWEGAAITPDMGKVTINKKDETISWGAVYHQYFEELEKIESHAGGVSVEKNVYRVAQTPEGEQLTALTHGDKVRAGDKLRVRLLLTSDKNLDYIHLEDGYASGFESTEQLSGYRYQDGLMYYQAMGDVSATFFIETMNQGTYVLEYDVIAEQQGHFSLGIATLQSLYAPEFSAHSQGMKIEVER